MKSRMILLISLLLASMIVAAENPAQPDSSKAAVRDTLQVQDADSIPPPGTFVPYDTPPQSARESCPQPVFPDSAKLKADSGFVLGNIYVNARGEVKKWDFVKVEPKGLGFEAAVEKILPLWKFSPAMDKGKPVGLWMLIPFKFYRTDLIAADSVPPMGTFVEFEIPPQPLPEASPQPAFPEKAKGAGVAGKVIAQVYINAHGDVKKWQVVKCEPKGMGFEVEVERVVPNWRFTPAYQKGKPVGVWVAIPFNFRYRK